jgi:hypothetical protein
MKRRLWLLVAGTIVLAACSGSIAGVCETPGVTGGENPGRDQRNYVDNSVTCSRPEPSDRATTPAPQVNP